jgi:hypothetical protein
MKFAGTCRRFGRVLAQESGESQVAEPGAGGLKGLTAGNALIAGVCSELILK